jgi:hypothetical protein
VKYRRLLISGIALAVALFCGWILHRTYHFVKEPYREGFRGEALTNDYLAAQRLIQRMGNPCTSIHGLPDPKAMPPARDTLVLPRRRSALSPGQVEALIGWVEGGGTLVAEGLAPELAGAPDTEDALFKGLGARLVKGDSVPDAKLEVELALGGVPMQVRLREGLKLVDTSGMAEEELHTQEGTQLLRYVRKQGTCYLVTRLSLLRNREIGDLDHAAFFCGMVLKEDAPQRAGGRVWLVAWEEPQSTWLWLRRNATPVLVALALLGLGLLWSFAPRFGPPQSEPDLARRSFLEHLDAAGAYHWQHDEGRPLLKACREAFLRRLNQIHPAWTHLPADDLCQRLALHTELPEARVFRALRYDTLVDAAGYLEAIQTLELLRKKL